MIHKKIVLLHVKVALLILFLIVSSSSLVFFFENFIIVFAGLVVVFVVSWLIVKSHLINDVLRMIQALKTLSEESKKVSEESKKVSEEHKKASEQLRESSLVKDKFLDIMTHDLRSPFQGIDGFTRLLLDRSVQHTEEERRDYLRHILQATKNANKLIERLSEWARLQTGRWTPNPQKFEISSLIANVVSFHQPHAVQRKIHLLADSKESFSVFADEIMLETALRNIVSNAIKFTQSDGFVKIDLRKEEKNVVIIVRDNGKGMSPGLMDNLFTLGGNVISPDISGNRGTGLGLILCKDLVEKNGGKIWVKSEVNKGSKIYFTIPLSS